MGVGELGCVCVGGMGDEGGRIKNFCKIFNEVKKKKIIIIDKVSFFLFFFVFLFVCCFFFGFEAGTK